MKYQQRENYYQYGVYRVERLFAEGGGKEGAALFHSEQPLSVDLFREGVRKERKSCGNRRCYQADGGGIGEVSFVDTYLVYII